MKQFHFILQAKGGVGKSFLTYLYALANEHESSVLFLDVDNSTKTSDRQLAFLRSQQRVAKLSLFNERDKQDRQLLLRSVLELSALPYNQYFLDFGAPESEQLPALLRRDIPATLFKRVEQQTQGQFIFHIVIGGNTAFKPCVEYLVDIVTLLGQLFPVIVHANQYGFVGPARADQQTVLQQFCQSNAIPLQNFGNIDADSEVGKQIIHYAQLGKGLSEYDFLERMLMEREIEQLVTEQSNAGH